MSGPGYTCQRKVGNRWFVDHILESQSDPFYVWLQKVLGRSIVSVNANCQCPLPNCPTIFVGNDLMNRETWPGGHSPLHMSPDCTLVHCRTILTVSWCLLMHMAVFCICVSNCGKKVVKQGDLTRGGHGTTVGWIRLDGKLSLSSILLLQLLLLLPHFPGRGFCAIKWF